MSAPAYLDSPFLRACRREAVPHTPVWFMRQAGRYMPEYRAIKERATFLEMCRKPDLAVEVTLQPVRAFGVDAAILFSDILIPLAAMGVTVDFNPGPHIPDPVRTRAQVEALRTPKPADSVPFVLEAVRRLRKELPAHVPLIGFCGAPWTLACYATEGAGGKEPVRMKRLCYEDPVTAAALLDKLTAMNAEYLAAQIEAGAQAVQIFDTWAQLLHVADYDRWSLPYVQRLIQRVREATAHISPAPPIIYFARESGALLAHVAHATADVVSVDWRAGLDTARRVLGGAIAVQGNLDPWALFAPWDELRRHADEVLALAGKQPGHIFNLGHGILQETPVDNVRRLVAYVHERTAVR